MVVVENVAPVASSVSMVIAIVIGIVIFAFAGYVIWSMFSGDVT